jgi:tetratricopeptide (TPR) repeat protein
MRAPALPSEALLVPAGQHDWSGQRCLVVDDFIGVRQLLRESLRSLGVKHIDLASNGAEAMTLLAKTPYQVVLCDYHLGEGKNGQQLLEEARIRQLLLPSCLWLMVSAEKSVEAVMGAAEHQPDAYLLKPITEGVLLTRLNRVWQKKQVFQAIDQHVGAKDYLRAARLCDDQIERNKVHEIDLLRMKATLMLKSGEPELARAAYERVLAQHDYAWASAGLAGICMAKGEFAQAQRIFERVIASNRYYLDAYDQLASACLHLGQPEAACSVLERAATLSPNSVPRQRRLGQVSLDLGKLGMAEKAFRKCIAIGAYSAMRSADAHFGLARVCGRKNEIKEALLLLAAARRDFPEEQVELRAKICEGMVYHESGDFRRARQCGDELEAFLNAHAARPDTSTCLDLAGLLFAVGVKQAPAELLCYLIRNNDDNGALLAAAQKLFDQARMGEEGAALIAAEKKRAADLMNQGVLLWKTGQLPAALEWMRQARAALPDNQRILFNAAQILLSHMQQSGYDPALAAEATQVLLHVDKIEPGQRRFAQLMEQLAQLAARPEPGAAPPAEAPAPA